MEREASLRRRVAQYARFQHGFRAGKALLVRLKDQLDRAIELVRMAAEQLRRAEKHCRVHIVAAGVHAAVLRAEGQVGLLGDAQRVHIRTQQDAAAGRPAGDFGDDAARKLTRLITHFAQALRDIASRVRQVGSGLGRGVQMAAVIDDSGLKRFGFGKNAFRRKRHGFSSSHARKTRLCCLNVSFSIIACPAECKHCAVYPHSVHKCQTVRGTKMGYGKILETMVYLLYLK